MQQILKYKWLIAAISSLALISCEKVVDLDLNTAESRIVIEGNITSEPGPYSVSLTTSGDYYTSEGINPISGASIIIKDELGQSDTLIEMEAGKYLTSLMTGESNMTYTIVVNYNDITYSGAETLPEKVFIDSLSYELMENIGPGSGHEEKTSYTIFCSFLDPITTENYYRFIVLVNGKPVGGFRNYYYLASDQLFNGQLVEYPIRGIEANMGDIVNISLETIGYNTYEYFRTLNDALSSGGMGSTPYNPVTNLNNDALGYFGAYTIDMKSVVLN